MVDLLNYDTSPLNPALKIVIPLVFLVVVVLYLRIRKNYSGKLRTFIDLLLLFGLLLVLAGEFRYFGDGTIFGFTKDYSLKWFQSIVMLAGAACFVAAGYRFLHLLEEKSP